MTGNSVLVERALVSDEPDFWTDLKPWLREWVFNHPWTTVSVVLLAAGLVVAGWLYRRARRTAWLKATGGTGPEADYHELTG